MSVECERVGGINLSQGVCDMPTPEPVCHGAISAIQGGQNSYTRHDGVAELRQAIAAKMHAFNKIEADPETEVVVSAGSTGAFYCACMALLNPGDEIVIFEPYYGYHIQTILAVDAVPVYVKMSPPDWSYRIEDVQAAISPKTKGIMINTPANPSGKVFSERELTELLQLAEKHDLFVFTDEIYEYITYDGLKHISPGSLPGAKDRVVTISGFSKTFSITGWRIGYSVCRPDWAQMIGYMSDLVYVCAPSALQFGAATGLLRLSRSYYEELCGSLLKKRDQICSALSAARLTPYKPAGAYYVLADISRVPGNSSKERAMRLLADTSVACVPGEAFFDRSEDGDSLARFCYAKPDNALDEACARLHSWNGRK